MVGPQTGTGKGWTSLKMCSPSSLNWKVLGSRLQLLPGNIYVLHSCDILFIHGLAVHVIIHMLMQNKHVERRGKFFII